MLGECNCKTLPWLTTGVRVGGGARGAAAPPPSLVRNIYHSDNFYLRVGQSSCSCFVSLIFLIFSFHLSLAPSIKTHTKTQEMTLKKLFFEIFLGSMPPTLLEVLAPKARVGQIRVRPPKFLSPYVYVAIAKAVDYKLQNV